MSEELDCVTIGNAIVDIYTQIEDDFLQENDIIKGAMNLVDAQRAEFLFSRMGESVKASGGSAANTAAGIASFGGKAAFMGKVASDHLGQVFAHDLRAQGVFYDTPPANGGAPTARSMIFITKDSERSMNTYLGACATFGPEDVDIAKIAAAKVTYFEGYLWDPPRAKEAIRLSADIAHDHGRQVALSLSDPFCVDRYRDEFLALIDNGEVDIVFANAAEVNALYQTDDFDKAIRTIGASCRHFAAITCGEQGCVIANKEETLTIAALPADHLVDTTGAGDLYAAGFLYGYTQGKSLYDAARLGCLAASLVIQQIGPRPHLSLREAALREGML